MEAGGRGRKGRGAEGRGKVNWCILGDGLMTGRRQHQQTRASGYVVYKQHSGWWIGWFIPGGEVGVGEGGYR